MQTLSIHPDGTRVIVQAYANFNGLENACRRNGKMKKNASLNHFVRGFNRRQAFFNFVDVGDWKEGADHKIRGKRHPHPLSLLYNRLIFASLENLEFFIHNQSCKHIIFGGCHDSGYASFLGTFAANASHNKRITLLQGGAIHPNIASLGFDRTVKFDSVFAPKSTPKPSTLHPTPSPAPDPSPSVASTSSQKKTYGPLFINYSSPSKRLGSVLYDSGRRVDQRLSISPRINAFPLGRTLQKNLCPSYYLQGRCTGCMQSHSYPDLSDREFVYLWYLARGTICEKAFQGEVCKDPLCIYGHEKGNMIGTGERIS